ncbi:hypothetical protein SDC9_142049 [bioreactor metagenome]|uniref:Uncharacterized protein n=1 Tax=bioreactor metagenome TaxID=1076179 RepID=A0A645DZE2_9ZZZZ
MAYYAHVRAFDFGGFRVYSRVGGLVYVHQRREAVSGKVLRRERIFAVFIDDGLYLSCYAFGIVVKNCKAQPGQIAVIQEIEKLSVFWLVIYAESLEHIGGVKLSRVRSG